MAQKKITDLQLADEMSADINLPGDDGIQTYRVTGQQVKDYILPDGGLARAKLATGAIAKGTVTSKAFADSPYTADAAVDDIILINATSGATTVNLPAATGLGGKRFMIIKTDSSTNAVTIDGNSSETIGGLTVQKLTYQYQSLDIICDGSNWQVIGGHKQVQMCIVRDEKSQNTAGGTATSGSWGTRVLNTIYGGNGWASLASNQITLQPGEYFVEFDSPFLNTGASQARLADTTNTQYYYGTSLRAAPTGDGQDTPSSRGYARLVLTSAAVLELQYRVGSTYSTSGLGSVANFATEVYGQVRITKVA